MSRTNKIEVEKSLHIEMARFRETRKLTVAGETRVACVRLGVHSDSDVVGVDGAFCWL